MLLGGCNIYEAAYTDQPLGLQLGVDAWMDHTLMPLTGCDALSGTWNARGNIIRDDRVDESVLAAAVGMADDHPDAAFAEEVRVERRNDGTLLLEALDQGRVIATRIVSATNVRCDSAGFAEVRMNGIHRLAVDAAGALWVGEHRFPNAGGDACSQVGLSGKLAPHGMATIARGPGAHPVEPENPEQFVRVRTSAATMGVKIPPTAMYLLPGERAVKVRVFLQPESRWQFNVPNVLIEVRERLQACHTYLLVGGSERTDTAGDTAWAALVDMGLHFDWRRCALSQDRDRIRVGRSAVEVDRFCFADAIGKESSRTFAVEPVVVAG